jgi:hypothetical protein
MVLGALVTQSYEFKGKHYGYHERDHYDHDRYYHEGQSHWNNYRICEQMPVSELALMVQGRRQLQSAWRV